MWSRCFPHSHTYFGLFCSLLSASLFYCSCQLCWVGAGHFFNICFIPWCPLNKHLSGIAVLKAYWFVLFWPSHWKKKTIKTLYLMIYSHYFFYISIFLIIWFYQMWVFFFQDSFISFLLFIINIRKIFLAIMHPIFRNFNPSIKTC